MKRELLVLVAGAAVGLPMVADARVPVRPAAAASSSRSAAAAPATDAVGAVSRGAVVFSSGYDVSVANIDGAGLRRLAAGWRPVWSPDAKQIAFETVDSVDVINPDGTHLRRLISGSAHVWSPDSRKIAIADRPWSEHAVPGFTIVNRDGSSPIRVPTAPGSPAAWSPDGKTIAFVRGAAGAYSVFAYDIGSGASRPLSGSSFDVPLRTLTWSPAGQTIAYELSDQHGYGLIDVASGRVSQLPDLGGAPLWSPDGNTIAAISGYDVVLLDLASGRLTEVKLRGDSWKVWTLVWSPNGTQLAFVGEGGLYTIGRDGQGERRLAAVGDHPGAVAWSADGRTLVYTRLRFPPVVNSAATDLWRIDADGTGAAPITRAFPTGASFDDPDVAATTVAVRPSPPPPAVALRPSRLVAVAGGIDDLAADTGRVAIAKDACSIGCAATVGIWDGGKRPSWLSGDGYLGDVLVLAGRRALWIDHVSDEPPTDAVVTGAAGSRPSVLASASADTYAALGNLAGDGELLVFNTWNEPEQGARTSAAGDEKLWRVVGHSKRLLLAGRDAADVAAVDGGRIAVVRRDGRLLILNEQGRRIAAWQLGRAGLAKGTDLQKVVGVRLSGQRLAAFRRSMIEVRDAKTGTIERRWRGAAGADAASLDVDRDLAVYTAGIAIHLLRLSDGRDRVLSIPHEGEPAHADLEPEGLYYSYNRTDTDKPGRAAFVPLRELRAKLG